MKLKTNSAQAANLLLFFFLFLLWGCKKEPQEPQESTPPSAVVQLLTAKTWKYYEYFTQYDQKSATVAYKIGKPVNQLDLSLNRVTFKTDKTYFEITQTGDTLKGTWTLSADEKRMEVKNAGGTFNSVIINLASNSFVWNDQNRDVYARMIPADYTVPTSVINSKLAGKKWMYVEYFTDYSRSASGLAFKRDKANNLMDLTRNRVLFNADGSVREIDQSGNLVPGTWSFITVGLSTATQTNNYLGTFQSILINLDDSTLVWYDQAHDRYGKMKVDTSQSTAPVSARGKLLTAKSWVYTEYFSNYTTPAAELSYKRDKTTNNPLNYSTYSTTFNLDGTYTETTGNGTIYNGTWQFLENETKLRTTSSSGTYTSQIIQLDSTGFIWFDADHKTFGKMQYSPGSPNYTINTTKLTEKTWIYYEYFNQYSTTQAALVYKRERDVNALDLKSNTTVFHANGTFNEYTENGQSITGTWQIINGNQLYTVNSLGTSFTSTIINLDDNSLIWYSPRENTYGKEIIKSN